MKVIDLLNKIANGELEENTKFYDKYVHKTYIYKPKSYAGIYPDGIAYANDNWYLTLKSGSFRLENEIEIIEDTPKEDKKIEKIKIRNTTDNGLYVCSYIEINGNTYCVQEGDMEYQFAKKINAIIDYLNSKGDE